MKCFHLHVSVKNLDKSIRLWRGNLSPRQLLREKGTPYVELGLADEHLSDSVLLDAMLAHPILINRPIVVTPWGVKLCRPSDATFSPQTAGRCSTQ